METFVFLKTEINDIMHIIKEHSTKLSSPWDSYMEDNLFKNDTYMILDNDELVGYASVSENNLFSFYVSKLHYQYAPEILSSFVRTFDIKKVHVLTNDSLLISLLMEWEYEIEDKSACFFSDCQRMIKPDIKTINPVFREAKINDINKIILHTGDFFDKLEDRIEEKSIFLLENNNELMGCGIIEIGKIHMGCASIGMITCKDYRQKGVAGMILWNLKELVYKNNLRPIAGCWYYNTLSRKSLEASGMIATGKMYTVNLMEKKTPPLRTGRMHQAILCDVPNNHNL